MLSKKQKFDFNEKIFRQAWNERLTFKELDSDYGKVKSILERYLELLEEKKEAQKLE